MPWSTRMRLPYHFQQNKLLTTQEEEAIRLEKELIEEKQKVESLKAHHGAPGELPRDKVNKIMDIVMEQEKKVRLEALSELRVTMNNEERLRMTDYEDRIEKLSKDNAEW